MRLISTPKALAFTASALALTIAAGSPAYAQSQDPADPTQQEEAESAAVDAEAGQPAEGGSIVVTGSRIRSPNLISNQPITSVPIQDLTQTGDISIGDALNDLPSIRSTYSQSNSGRFIGTAGLNVLDLRGLGTSRTLTLQNGRRLPAAIVGTNLVDVNIVPTDLIERVDVVTGGNSAIYGSDAVAGVVNFILRRDFDGIRIRGQAGISEEGDRGNYFTSALIGRNFADGRGNVTFNVEYARQNPLYFTDRPELTGAYSGRCQFNLAEPTAGEPASGDGVPDNQFFCGVRNASIADQGMFTANATAAQCQSATFFTSTVGAARCLNFGTPQGQPRVFVFAGPNGNAVENVPGIDFRPFGSGNFQGGTGLGSTLQNVGQLAAGLKRYSANLTARFEVTPALVPFVEGTYVHLDGIQEGQASFFQSSFPAFFGGGRGIRCDNPYITAQQLGVLQNAGRCAGGAASTETIPVARFNTDFGGRRQYIDRDVFRIVGGLQGEFNEDWNYELSANYGRFQQTLSTENNLLLFDGDFNPAGFLQATDVIRDASGNIVCRDPAARAAGCLPVNVLGHNPLTQAQSDYIHHTSISEEWHETIQVLAFVSGDSSQLFELPGGPIGFAAGLEYRREDAFQAYDPVTANGQTFFNAIQAFEPPAMEVKEAFGEIRAPLLRDAPFADLLELTVAGRVSDYNNNTGTVYAYNLGGTWAPVPDLRFRAVYSTSVRSPTLSDLYSPFSQNFAFVQDPCDMLYRGNNPNYNTNCNSAGVPATFVNAIARSQTIEYRSGGNELLQEERGKSWTAGMVFTPSFVPGLSITADYYDIEVESLIATLGPQTILNLCYGDPTGLDNQYCALIQRDPDGNISNGYPISGGINYAAQNTRGVDVDIAYRRSFDNGHRLSLRLIGTRVLALTNHTNPVNPSFGNRQLGELGDPQWAANFNLNYDMGQFDLGYTVRYLGKQTIGAWENYFSFQGRAPENADFTEERFYPEAFYHNIRFGWEVDERFNFYFGVDNLFNEKPPYGLMGTAGGDPYESFGRYFYFGSRIDF
jgi:outer membrane receptor protein involved in Fe transport